MMICEANLRVERSAAMSTASPSLFHSATAAAAPARPVLPRWRLLSARNGLACLMRRARIRQAALALRPLNALLLLVAAATLGLSTPYTSLPVVALLGLAALSIEILALPPRQRRGPRIVSEARRAHVDAGVQAAPSRRLPRILLAELPPGWLALPPSRPRFRTIPRRPEMIPEEEEE